MLLKPTHISWVYLCVNCEAVCLIETLIFLICFPHFFQFSANTELHPDVPEFIPPITTSNTTLITTFNTTLFGGSGGGMQMTSKLMRKGVLTCL